MSDPASDPAIRAERPLQSRVMLLVVASTLIVAIALVVKNGVGWDSLKLPLRVTARISVVLFSLAFAVEGVPLWRSWQAPAALAFAASHFIHLGLILVRATVGNHLTLLIDPEGILTYSAIAFIAWCGLADYADKPMSRRVRAIKSSTYWLVWLAFGYSLIGKYLSIGAPRPAVYLILIGFLSVAAVARLGCNLIGAFRPQQVVRY